MSQVAAEKRVPTSHASISSNNIVECYVENKLVISIPKEKLDVENSEDLFEAVKNHGGVPGLITHIQSLD